MKWVFAFFLCHSANASIWTAIEKNNQGVRHFQNELNSSAHSEFMSALSEEPLSEIHINLGLTFEVNEEYEKAFSEYQNAFKGSKTDQVKFFSLFNSARMLAQLKKVPQALAFYQAALEIFPGSLETKTNIELLIQQQQNQGGKGQGKDDQKNKKNDKDQEGKNQEKDKDKDKEGKFVNRKKQKPKPFKSQHLTKKDVDKILEELKNQEKKIRKKQNDRSGKETPLEKDW